MQIELNSDVDQHTPPKRTDTVQDGQTIRKATAEAHDRESRNEAATERQLVEKKNAELPPDDGEGGTWQREEKEKPRVEAEA